MKSSSTKKNFLYNLSLNIINILFPLITSPYISRILGANNLGKYSFSLSFSSWFLVFATFGTNTYGIREIAKVRDNKKLLEKTFSEIFLINFIATLITLSAYLVIIFLNPRTNSEIALFLVSALSILLNLFCIDWLYMGIDRFRIITLRSLLIKVLCLISIFVFIRHKNDYVIYALISVIAFGFANILNFIYSRKLVKITIKSIDLRPHIKKISVFFCSNIVVSMYTLFDQIFLGFLSTNKDLAFYYRAKQIYGIALSITLSISTVLLPQFVYLYKNDINQYKQTVKKSINYIYFFSVPSVCGLIILSKDIMWFFGGKEFQNAYISLIIMSILVFIVSLGTWQFNQIFLPLGKEKVALKNQIFMAIISITSNACLVPRLEYIGASISLVLTEVCGTLYAIYYSKKKMKEINIQYITKPLLKYSFASFFMLFVLAGLEVLKLGPICNMFLGIFIGLIIYLGVLLIVKDEVCMETINFMINIIKKCACLYKHNGNTNNKV